MSPRARRIVIPLIVLGFAIGIGFSVVSHRQSRLAHERAEAAKQLEQSPEETPGQRRGAVATGDGRDADRDAVGGDRTGQTEATGTADPSRIPPPAREVIEHWRAFAPVEEAPGAPIPNALGSFDPETHRMRVEFSDRAAGIDRIVFSDYWETAVAKRRAAAARRAGEPLPAELASERYVLQQALGRDRFDIPLLAMSFVEVEGHAIGLFGRIGDVWAPDGTGGLVTTIHDTIDGGRDGEPLLRIRRRFSLAPGSYDIEVEQSIENLSPTSLRVQVMHYGPPDLRLDRDRYIDIRRHHFGYILPNPPAGRPPTVITEGQMRSRADVLKALKRGDTALWPNQDSRSGNLTLSWYGTTNRYFAMAIHPTASAVTAGVRTLDSAEEIAGNLGLAAGTDEVVLTEVFTPVFTLGPGATQSFDIGVYAGPLDSRILADVEPFAALGMSGLIRYLMSECCTMCTFPWLASLLLTFLTFLHDWIFRDWALSIIGLVLIVRLLLHPLLKRSQINMQRFGKQMAELKPEMDRLQQKYKDDRQRLQAEQMRLYREKGINPVGCIGGIVPMLLQAPIWIALYAMLYFAFELRQQPAFFGVFQLFGGWSFLGDLSSADHFFWEFQNSHQFLLWNVTGINLLPLLMGVVFYFQQKYMTPPTAMKMSPEMEQQQKLMKIMMVVMFPLMLYSAPSGLTLYILTSTIIGIVEMRYIRRHIATLDAMPKSDAPKKKKKQDMIGRMYEQALDRARDRAASKKKPPKRFKDREE